MHQIRPFSVTHNKLHTVHMHDTAFLNMK